MPKRKSDDRERIKSKIRKLKKKLRRTKRRVCDSDDSELSESSSSSYCASLDYQDKNKSSPRLQANENPAQPEMESEPEPVSSTPAEPATPAPEESVLDSQLLEILGLYPTKHKKYGKNIQNNLSIKFQHWTTMGISKELHKELKEKYLTPENAKLIDAPELNAEIKATISDAIIKRDEAIESKQKKITLAITALGEAITLTQSEKERNTTLEKLLLDSSRIICDSQYAVSVTRRNFLLNSVNKDIRKQLQNAKIDKLLFGENLAETIKSAKIINKYDTNRKSLALKPPNNEVPHTRTANPPRNTNWKNPDPDHRATSPPRMKEPAMTSTLSRPGSPTNRVRYQRQRKSYYMRQNTENLQVPLYELEDYPGARNFIREAMIRRNIPSSSIDEVLNSISAKDYKEYDYYYKYWFSHCKVNNWNVYEVTNFRMITILRCAYYDGTRLPKLNLYRAAFSHITKENIYENDELNRFFKSRPS